MYERMNIEDWKAKKKNDRDAVLADQKQALQEVLQDGAQLTAYLLGRGRLGSGITSGNAALVLKACPQATAVMSFDGWNQFGRRVSKGAVGISQLVRSGGYFTVGKVYDRSATYGNKPCPTVELQGDQLGKAVAVLTALSPVEVQFDDKQPTGFLADENLILYPSGASNEEILARLPADIVLATAVQCYAEVGNEEYLHQMALAVSVEVCGRLGLAPPADAADRLNGLRAHIPAGEERRALEEVREMAKVFGDLLRQKRHYRQPDRGRPHQAHQRQCDGDCHLRQRQIHEREDGNYNGVFALAERAVHSGGPGKRIRAAGQGAGRRGNQGVGGQPDTL